MGKQPTTGQKKSKDQIIKAASQKKGTVKVHHLVILRNGQKEKLKKKLIMLSSLIKPLTNVLFKVFPKLENTSQSHKSSKNIKLSDQLLELS